MINVVVALVGCADRYVACRDKHAGAEDAFMTNRKNADSAVAAADGYVYALLPVLRCVRRCVLQHVGTRMYVWLQICPWLPISDCDLHTFCLLLTCCGCWQGKAARCASSWRSSRACRT